jgi:hypothetical protein
MSTTTYAVRITDENGTREFSSRYKGSVVMMRNAARANGATTSDIVDIVKHDETTPDLPVSVAIDILDEVDRIDLDDFEAAPVEEIVAEAERLAEETFAVADAVNLEAVQALRDAYTAKSITVLRKEASRRGLKGAYSGHTKPELVEYIVDHAVEAGEIVV